MIGHLNIGAIHGHPIAGFCTDLVISKRKEKVFEAKALKNKVLVISSQTAFEIEYLVEISYTVEINSDNFEGLNKQPNAQPQIANGNLGKKRRPVSQKDDRCLHDVCVSRICSEIWNKKLPSG